MIVHVVQGEIEYPQEVGLSQGLEKDRGLRIVIALLLVLFGVSIEAERVWFDSVVSKATDVPRYVTEGMTGDVSGMK